MIFPVKLADADRTDLESVSSLPIQTSCRIVRQSFLVDVKMAEGPAKNLSLQTAAGRRGQCERRI